MKKIVHDTSRKRMYAAAIAVHHELFLFIIESSFSKHIQFGALSPDEIVWMAETECWQKDLYNPELRAPADGGVLDRRMVRNHC